MAEFGGSGGISGGRPLDEEDRFEALLAQEFGDRVRASEAFAQQLWSALANIDWTNGPDTAGYTFRAAGDVVAAIRGEGDYLDWYCGSADGVVSDEIAAALAAHGWSFRNL